MTVPPTQHGTVVVLDETGVLVTGPSQSGKTSLALALLERWTARGRFAALVADDRVILEASGGRLIARVPAVIAGLAERCGRGIGRLPHEPAAVIGLHVPILPTVDRMPETTHMTGTLSGVSIARQPVPARSTAVSIPLVEAALAESVALSRCDTAMRQFLDCLLRS